MTFDCRSTRLALSFHLSAFTIVVLHRRTIIMPERERMAIITKPYRKSMLLRLSFFILNGDLSVLGDKEYMVLR